MQAFAAVRHWMGTQLSVERGMLLFFSPSRRWESALRNLLEAGDDHFAGGSLTRSLFHWLRWVPGVTWVDSQPSIQQTYVHFPLLRSGAGAGSGQGPAPPAAAAAARWGLLGSCSVCAGWFVSTIWAVSALTAGGQHRHSAFRKFAASHCCCCIPARCHRQT